MHFSHPQVPEIPGMAALDMNAAEDRIVSSTREVVPGMVLAGESPAWFCVCVHLLFEVQRTCCCRHVGS